MSDYPFLTSLLPELSIEEEPELTFVIFRQLLRINLRKNDKADLHRFLLYYDLENVRKFWKGEEISPYGNYNEVELEEAILTLDRFPNYVYRYFEEHRDEEERFAHFPEVISLYLRNEGERASGFVQLYLEMERDLRLVLLGFRAKKESRDLIHELRFEDANDQMVMQMVAQRDSATFIPPFRYEDLKPLFEEHGEDPMALHLALLKWKFQKIDQFVGVRLFTMDRILGFLAQLIQVEQFQKLNQEMGQQEITGLLNMKVE